MDRNNVLWKRFYNTNMPSGGGGRGNRGDDGNFTAAHWTPRESGLIGPVQLAPMESFQPR